MIAVANALGVHRGAQQGKGPCSNRWAPPRPCAACMLQSIVLRARLHLHACAVCACSCTGCVGRVDVCGVCHGCDAHGLSTLCCLVTPPGGRCRIWKLKISDVNSLKPMVANLEERLLLGVKKTVRPRRLTAQPGTAPGQSIQMCFPAQGHVSHGHGGHSGLSMSHFTLRSPCSGVAASRGPAASGGLKQPTVRATATLTACSSSRCPCDVCHRNAAPAFSVRGAVTVAGPLG